MKITTTAFIFHNNKLLLVFHKKINKWMHVGGHVEENESFDDALRREIKEEVNLDVEIIDCYKSPIKNLDSEIIVQKKPFFIHCTNKNGMKKICLDYICIVKEPVKVKLQESELSDFKWVNKEELEKLDMFPLLKELTIRAFEEYGLRD